MKTCISILVIVVCFCGVASADLTPLSWQTTPVLGIDSSFDGDVHIDNGWDPWAIIPDDVSVPIRGQPTSITTFYVGQELHTGSGVYYDIDIPTYNWSRSAVGPMLTVIETGTYSSGTDGFTMLFGNALGGLSFTSANVGNWTYTETWTNTLDANDKISFTVDFIVVPVHSAVLLGLLGLGAVGLKLRKFA